MFGLCNAAQSFQRFMNSVLQNLDFCYVYLDDILIVSRSSEEDLAHRNSVFSRLREYGLNASKCIFRVREIEYLGYLITDRGIQPLPAKVETIRSFPKPSTIKQLRQFLGIINFYRRFIKNAAKFQAPLNDMLKGSVKNDKRQVPWTVKSDTAFENCQNSLADATLLYNPIGNAPLSHTTDASDKAIGSVLEQLNIYESIKYFRFMVEGRNLIIRCDHKPLIFAFQQNADKASPRQFRHLEFISQFTTKITHISGNENLIADTMSRICQIDIPCIVSYKSLAEEQQKYELKHLLKGTSSLTFRQLTPFNANQSIFFAVSDNKIRPYIPAALRKNIFNALHNLSHPGSKATCKLIKSKYIWPHMNKDICIWSKNCTACQK